MTKREIVNVSDLKFDTDFKLDPFEFLICYDKDIQVKNSKTGKYQKLRKYVKKTKTREAVYHINKDDKDYTLKNLETITEMHKRSIKIDGEDAHLLDDTNIFINYSFQIAVKKKNDTKWKILRRVILEKHGLKISHNLIYRDGNYYNVKKENIRVD